MVAKLTAQSSLRAAIDEVASRDPVLADLVARVGPIRHRPHDPDGPFAALLRAIVFQQLAGNAAQAIYGRVRATVGDTLTPETLNAASDAALRAAGLSANKLASLRDLSAKVLDGTVVLSRTSSTPKLETPIDRAYPASRARSIPGHAQVGPPAGQWMR